MFYRLSNFPCFKFSYSIDHELHRFTMFELTHSVLFRLSVLLTPGLCKYITVCQEEDQDIRVDCNIESKANQLPTYTFIMSSGKKEHIINTNSTTERVADQFKGKSTVEQLPTGGFRLRLQGYTPPENTTFTCRSNIGTNPDHMVVEKGKETN